MATDEDVRSRLDRIIIRVQGGMNIHDALTKENLFRWYYREIVPQQRAPVDRARAEYLATHNDRKPDNAKSWVVVECFLPVDLHGRFKTACAQEGVTMNQKMRSQVIDYLNPPSPGVGSGVGSKV